MKYIRTKQSVYKPETNRETNIAICCEKVGWIFKEDIIAQADNIEKLCDCFVKIKRNKGCKDYILKFDHKDLPILRQQRIKYPASPVYGAIHVEDKGLIYIAKMNDKGELELL